MGPQWPNCHEGWGLHYRLRAPRSTRPRSCWTIPSDGGNCLIYRCAFCSTSTSCCIPSHSYAHPTVHPIAIVHPPAHPRVHSHPASTVLYRYINILTFLSGCEFVVLHQRSLCWGLPIVVPVHIRCLGILHTFLPTMILLLRKQKYQMVTARNRCCRNYSFTLTDSPDWFCDAFIKFDCSLAHCSMSSSLTKKYIRYHNKLVNKYYKFTLCKYCSSFGKIYLFSITTWKGLKRLCKFFRYFTFPLFGFLHPGI